MNNKEFISFENILNYAFDKGSDEIIMQILDNKVVMQLLKKRNELEKINFTKQKSEEIFQSAYDFIKTDYDKPYQHLNTQSVEKVIENTHEKMKLKFYSNKTDEKAKNYTAIIKLMKFRT